MNNINPAELQDIPPELLKQLFANYSETCIKRTPY